MLYYIVRVFSAIINLTIVPKETYYAKAEKRYNSGGTVDKFLDLKYQNNYSRCPCPKTAGIFLACSLEVNFQFFFTLLVITAPSLGLIVADILGTKTA